MITCVWCRYWDRDNRIVTENNEKAECLLETDQWEACSTGDPTQLFLTAPTFGCNLGKPAKINTRLPKDYRERLQGVYPSGDPRWNDEPLDLSPGTNHIVYPK